MVQRIDEYGDDVVDEPVATTEPKAKRASDYDIALRAIGEWGRPLAWHCGVLWSTNEFGAWGPVDAAFMALLAKLRGRSGRMILTDIVGPMVEVPGMDNVEQPACYWVWTRDRWNPLHLAPYQVLFADGIVAVGDRESHTVLRDPVFGAQLTMPYQTESGDAPVCAEFIELVEHAFPDPATRDWFQQLAGLILQPHVLLRGQIALWGPPMTGKTTLATALACAAAGARGFSAVQEAELVRDKWASFALLHKFANVSDESPRAGLWVPWMKRYTSGTYLVEPKFHRPTWAPSTAKLISTTNEIQDLSDASGAAGLRFFPFYMDRPLPRGTADTTERMSPIYWSEPRRRAGVVSWMIEGLNRLWSRGGELEPPADWSADRAKALDEADPIEAWLKSEVKVDAGSVVLHSDLIASCPPHLADQAKRIEMQLRRYMLRLFGSRQDRRRISGAKTRVWVGVAPV